ncbi:MAG TPA: type II toxin-antitoxin system VapC family toxin [bacterium]|nr:type II toxin-antitoxin system VapC family toxin [bacterium]
MIVVDTNVIAYLWIPGDLTLQAERVLSEDSEWSSPVLWRSEFRNVMAGLLRRGKLPFETALQIVEKAEEQLRGREYAVASQKIMNLVRKSPCSAYDCEFVALAEELDVSLVTTDRKVIAAFPRIAVPLKEFRAE